MSAYCWNQVCSGATSAATNVSQIWYDHPCSVSIVALQTGLLWSGYDPLQFDRTVVRSCVVCCAREYWLENRRVKDLCYPSKFVTGRWVNLGIEFSWKFIATGDRLSEACPFRVSLPQFCSTTLTHSVCQFSRWLSDLSDDRCAKYPYCTNCLQVSVLNVGWTVYPFWRCKEPSFSLLCHGHCRNVFYLLFD